MDAAAEDLDALYADFGETVCRANGAPDFLALHGVEDVDAFGSGTISEHRIRYRSINTLYDGEEVVIAGRAYRVPRTPPRRIGDGRECTLELIPA